MSGPSQPSAELITDKRQLVSYLESGCKPSEQWRIGTEHEKFAYSLEDYRRLPYEGDKGIRAMLEGLTRFGWQRVEENGHVIALLKGQASVTLEPGGQFELSGAPLDNIHQTCFEVHEHLDQVKEIGSELGTGMIGLGFDPKWRREDVPWMPKGRYKIMREYMPKRGKLGLDMMLRTCTVQVNLDFESEAGMAKKFRVGLALQPIATALFANSPFVEGKPSGLLSTRSHIWTDTDPDRTGDLPFVFESGFGFERYVEYMLDVPMYFVFREGKYIDAAGQSFRDFLAGKLPALPGELPNMSDWTDHLSTAFPEVRLKSFLEMRGADGGPWNKICALPAFWVGLLYDQTALDAAWDLVKGWDMAGREALRSAVPKLGLDAPLPGGGTLRDIAGEVLAISRAGLTARGKLNASGDNETTYLAPLDEIVASGKVPAQVLLDKFHGEWGGDISRVYEESF